MIEMSLVSGWFFLFFGASLMIYYLVPGSIQWFALLSFSILFFLLSATPYTMIYLVASVIGTTLCARAISSQKAAGQEKKARRALLIGIVFNAGVLAVLKYTNFFIGNLNGIAEYVFHIPGRIAEVHFTAPLGVSFYTLSIVAYLLDVFWGVETPQRSMLKTALFIGYFPPLTSGPITRYRQVKDSLFSPHPFQEKNLVFGLQRMLWGVFKKLVLASRLSVVVDAIYADTLTYDGLYVWTAAALFMLQLYTDFSGCMDIIIGASECYGIALPENFRTPFFSQSVQEFWQRWHITLGSWCKDYILYPILKSSSWRTLTRWVKNIWGKDASKKLPAYLGMLCIWLIVGLWHGGNWKYVLGMGLWFWGCIVLSQVLKPLSQKMTQALGINTDCFSWRLFQSLWVFALICFGNMFFRLDSVETTLKTMSAGLARWNPEIFFDGSLLRLGLDQKDFNIMTDGLLVLLLVSAMQEKGSIRERFARQNAAFRWLIVLGLIFSIIIFGMYGPGYDAQSFIYRGF